MFDHYNRKIDYLRISVTDRCNLRCTYCMPPEGIRLLRHEDILSFDEIKTVAETAVKMGVRKIRLTGGEPLVRKGITGLVRMIASIQGIEDLSMTTNGILLGNFAQSLQEAGLQRVNVSLDTLDARKYKEITRVGNLEDVLRGLVAAEKAGLSPIKLNCVVQNSSDEADANEVRRFGEEQGYQIRFIRKMDLASGEFYIVEGGEGGHCELCNRLRLTANGMLKPCLFDAQGYNVRELGTEEAIRRAIENKPACGTFNPEEQFYTIGG